jgi:hypothetical protein
MTLPQVAFGPTGKRLAWCAAISTLAALRLAPGAFATIVVGQGIAGVKLGESQTQVRKLLGKPRYIQPPGWGYGNPLGGWVGFDFNHRVNDIWTTSRRQTTNDGIGPGASVSSVKRAYPNVKCYTHRGLKWRTLCVLASRGQRPAVETDFLFKRTLDKIEIYFV